MKLKHVAGLAGGYLVAAFLYNRYVAGSIGFALPLDLIGGVLPPRLQGGI